MRYLTYDEYAGMTDDATLTVAEFNLAEFKARKRIDYWTDNRVQSMQAVPEAVKNCILAIMSLDAKYSAEAQAENPLIASFNTDGYSESYGSATEQTAGAEKAAAKVIRQYLYGELDDEGTPLLYRGV